MDKKTLISPRMTMAATLAAALGSMARFALMPQRSEPKPRKPVPTMVTASPEEIAAWNAAIAAKKPRRAIAIQLRRADIKARGLRQFKREAYLHHDGYADKHPAIAARYAF